MYILTTFFLQVAPEVVSGLQKAHEASNLISTIGVTGLLIFGIIYLDRKYRNLEAEIKEERKSNHEESKRLREEYSRKLEQAQETYSKKIEQVQDNYDQKLIELVRAYESKNDSMVKNFTSLSEEQIKLSYKTTQLLENLQITLSKMS